MLNSRKLIIPAFIATLLVSTIPSFAAYEDALKLFQDGKYTDSLKIVAEDLDTARDMEPNSPNYKLRYLAAYNHWKLGNDGSVIAHLKRCSEIDKSKAEPLIDLALFLSEKGQYPEATNYARLALEKAKNPMSFVVLGKVANGYQNYWGAKEYFEKAIAIDPQMDVAYNGLGIALMNLGKFDQAEIAFSAAAALNSRSLEILNNLAVCYERLGKKNEAIENCNKILAIDPENATIKQNLARLNAAK